MAAKKKDPPKDPVEDPKVDPLVIDDSTNPTSNLPAEGVDETPADPEPTPKPTGPTPEEIAQETKNQVYETVRNALGIEAKEGEDQYQTPWAKRGDKDPKNWDEVTEASVAMSEIKRQQIEAEAKQATEQEEKQTQEANNRMNKEWDNELSFLRSKKYIPGVNEDIQTKMTKGEVLTDEEKKDPGLVAQATLFATMNSLHKSGDDTTLSLRAIYHDHYENQKKEPAGADAPISGGTKSTEAEPGFNYDDIHNRKIGQIMRDKTED